MLDVNDCKPVFRSPVMEVYVREDAQIGDLVTTLTSVDQDEDKNADVTYAFISGKGLHEIFCKLAKSDSYHLVLIVDFLGLVKLLSL